MVMNTRNDEEKQEDIICSDKFVGIEMDPVLTQRPMIKTECSIQCYLSRCIHVFIPSEICKQIYPNGCHPYANCGPVTSKIPDFDRLLAC